MLQYTPVFEKGEELTNNGIDPVVVSVEETFFLDFGCLTEETTERGTDHSTTVHLQIPNPERSTASVFEHLFKIDTRESGSHTGRENGCDPKKVILGSFGIGSLSTDVVQLKTVCSAAFGYSVRQGD